MTQAVLRRLLLSLAVDLLVVAWSGPQRDDGDIGDSNRYISKDMLESLTAERLAMPLGA